MRLIELTKSYESLLYKLEQDETFDLEAELEKAEEAREEKLDRCCWMVRNLTLEAEAFASEAKRLKDKADKLEANAERLKKYVAFCLRGEGLKTKHFSLSFRKSEQVEILEPESLPDQYVRIKREPNKELIKQDLKNGATIKNCGLIKNLNLQIK